MSKSALLEKLDKATDRALSVALSRGYPLSVNKKSTLIGSTVIQKNKKGFYDICTVSGLTLYKDISVFDVAIIISQRYNSGELSVIKKVLWLEEQYTKHHSDMVHYLHSLKNAKKKNDFERMAILEDRFQVSEIQAKHFRDNISIFKRTK